MVFFSNVLKSAEVITLFHRPSVPASVRAVALLKQISAHASETATEDQAADHTSQNELQRRGFRLDVTEQPPTIDQARTLLDYIGGQNAGSLVDGARDEADALRKLKEDSKVFKWPVTVDWTNGKVVIGDNESEIMRLISQLPKEKDEA